jgi:hypothetical protein
MLKRAQKISPVDKEVDKGAPESLARKKLPNVVTVHASMQ